MRTSEYGDDHQPTAWLEDLYVAREIVGAGDIKDDIDAIAISEYGFGEVLLFVIDGKIGA